MSLVSVGLQMAHTGQLEYWNLTLLATEKEEKHTSLGNAQNEKIYFISTYLPDHQLRNVNKNIREHYLYVILNSSIFMPFQSFIYALYNNLWTPTVVKHCDKYCEWDTFSTFYRSL